MRVTSMLSKTFKNLNWVRIVSFTILINSFIIHWNFSFRVRSLLAADTVRWTYKLRTSSLITKTRQVSLFISRLSFQSSLNRIIKTFERLRAFNEFLIPKYCHLLTGKILLLFRRFIVWTCLFANGFDIQQIINMQRAGVGKEAEGNLHFAPMEFDASAHSGMNICD